MKNPVENHLVRRGKKQIYYCRLRIPAAIRAAYPGKTEIVRSLRTSDQAQAVKRLRIELVRIDGEFEERGRQQKERQDRTKLRRVATLTDEHVQCLAQFWVRNVLLTDMQTRQRGMDDVEFDERDQLITGQRQELGKMLARGNIRPILPAMYSFIHLCGLEVNLSEEQAQKTGYRFLEAAVTALDHLLLRQVGQRVDTDEVAPEVPHPMTFGATASTGPDWEEVFTKWIEFVKNRPKATIIANSTPWRQLQVFAAQRGVKAPGQLTPQHISEFADHMDNCGLAVKTMNGRLGKLRDIFNVAVRKNLLLSNPAEKALGFKEAAAQRGGKQRLPFTLDDLQVLFGSTVFTQHLRSSGQAGEASYWIPVIMFYTGARPEEIAGLQLSDIQQHPTVGWYFHITDIKDEQDVGLFDDQLNKEKVDYSEKRRLKNQVSRRKIPVAQELLSLGFLQYVDWVRKQDAVMLFPTLRPDFHGKLCGAFSKWFGRHKREIGFTSNKKVLYSLRHNMKDLLEAAKVPTKYLKRIMGHASGDGTVTDGYGSDVPLEIVHEYFMNIRFPVIPAQPWKPGGGYLRKHGPVSMTK